MAFIAQDVLRWKMRGKFCCGKFQHIKIYWQRERGNISLCTGRKMCDFYCNCLASQFEMHILPNTIYLQFMGHFWCQKKAKVPVYRTSTGFDDVRGEKGS